MGVTFTSEPTGHLDLRHGEFRVGSRRLPTPHFFPVMNVITGPPTPPLPTLANGGIWKWLKRLTLMPNVHVEGADHQPAVRGFLTQTLHFLDYNISPQMLQRWLPEGEEDCVTTLLERDIASTLGVRSARSKLPFVFVDSGGYQLLSAQRIDLSAFGWEATPKAILDLQLRFGGDFLATLDYPVHPLASDAEARQRFQMSMENAVRTMELLHKRGRDDKFPFLAVHGRSRKQTRDYTRALLARIEASPAKRVPFGLALGSLVPLNGSPAKLISVVAGALDALREAEDRFDRSRIPVHAFGVSSSVAPYLTLLGVDSYDGSSYAKAAHNLTYYDPGGFSPRKLHKLEALDCECAGCALIERGSMKVEGRTFRGLDAVKYACSPRSKAHTTYFRWKDGIVDDVRIPAKTREQKANPDKQGYGVPRSYFYALLALHNLNSNRRQVARVLDAGSDDLYRSLVEDDETSPKTAQIVRGIGAIYPDTRADMQAWGLGHLLEPPDAQGTTQIALEGIGLAPPTVDHRLGPEDFDVLDMAYRLPKGKPVLVLPCSKTKPYSDSATHRLVERALEAAGVAPDAYEKITLSGNYGPVPREHEDDAPVLAYDFLLHETNRARIDLVASRLRALLERDEDRYTHVVGYATQKPYRRALEIAFKGLSRCRLLPDPLKSHTNAEYRSEENLALAAESLMGKSPRRRPREAQQALL